MPEEVESTVEIPEAPAQKDNKPEVLTHEEAKEKGWSNTEIKKAEEFGMVGKKEPEPKEAKVEEPEVKDKKEDPKPEPTKIDKSRYELDAEKQAEFEKIFGPGTNPHGLFHGMKSQRNRAQTAESARDAAKLELKLKEQQLKEANERLEKLVSKASDPNGNRDEEDPLDKPLTVRQLKQMHEEEQKKRESSDGELKDKAQKIHLAIKEQEDYAKSQYPDFDETVKAGEDLIKRVNELEGPQQKKAVKMIQDLQIAAANADQYSIDSFNVADISYELGKFAKEILKPAGDKAEEKKDGLPTERKNGGLTPEQTKRVLDNASRRGSSASLSGSGGRRVVNVEDITLEDVVKMSRHDPEAYEKFRKEHPDKIKALLRG